MPIAQGNTADVIIIGAGMSGLFAAKMLAEKHQVNVLVLEARDRVGGRAYTVMDPKFGYMDLGAEYFWPSQHKRMLRVAKELGIVISKVSSAGDNVESFNGVVRRLDSTFSSWNPIEVWDWYRLNARIEKMSREIPTGNPSGADNARNWDQMNVKEFLDRECWTNYTWKIMEHLVRDSLAAEPCEVSLLFFLWIIKDGNEWCTENHQFVGGSQQICLRMAESLGNKVLLEMPVYEVIQDKKNNKMIVTCANGEQYSSDHVINTLPPSLLARINFSPSLPQLKLKLAQRFPMGNVIKCFSWYERPFWREKGFRGMVVSDSGPVYATMDEIRQDGRYSAIVGYILANEARFWSNKTTAERQHAVSGQYAVLFGSQEALKPSYYMDISWCDEEFTGGGYAGVLPCGVLTGYGNSPWWDPCGNVYFAGTETATEWLGYMEGALQAGERAAEQVLQAMGKLTTAYPGGNRITRELTQHPTIQNMSSTAVTCMLAAVLFATCYLLFL